MSSKGKTWINKQKVWNFGNRKYNYVCKGCKSNFNCSDSRKKYCSAECFAKNRIGYNKGRKFSDETRLKMSLAKKGKTWKEIYGNNYEEVLRKQKEIHSKIIKTPEWNLKNSIGNTGKKMSDESKIKMSISRKKLLSIPENKLKALEIMNKGSQLPNNTEKKVINIINNLQLNFIYVGDYKKWLVCDNQWFNPDFINDKDKKIIEVDGVYWHSKPEHIEKDIRKKKAYEKLGYSTLNLTDKEINNNIKETIKKIMEFSKT